MTLFLSAGVCWLLLCTPILAVFHGSEKRARLERDSRRDGGMKWLPRIGYMPAATPGLCDDPHRMDFDGRVLVIQWGRFVVEVFAGRRK